MLKLYGFPNTTSMRVAWALEEAGVEYEYQKINVLKGDGRRPSFLRINPSGKVPALTDGDFVLTESAAIVTYIGDCFPDSYLVPPCGTRQRASYAQWSVFAVAEFEQPLRTIAKHRFGLPMELRVPAVEDAAKWEFARVCRVVEKGLGDQEWILAGDFSAADILLSHVLAWAESARIPVESDALKAYLARALARPALARAQAREAAT